MEAPETQSPGISQMRKKPRMWSMRYAEKYLHDAHPPSALAYFTFAKQCSLLRKGVDGSNWQRHTTADD